MKISHREIFDNLKGQGIFPVTLTQEEYGARVREFVLAKVAPNATQDSAIYSQVSELSLKFSKCASYHWKKKRRKPSNAFFSKEMEVLIWF